MNTTQIYLHSKHQIAKVDERCLGGFIEHLGRCVYDGVVDKETFEPRPKVLEALRALRMTAMRYPGGNFVSGYHWMDGVGPKKNRPRVRELAWNSTEPNQFGTDEYIAMCRSMNWTPMLTVNLGTGTPEEAGNWTEYCNSPAGTKFADMRVANGNREPFSVKLWCLGNEVDGPWQLGHMPAKEYALKAQQAAKIMKDCDPSIELVACGECVQGQPWNREVLHSMGDFADYISLHYYANNRHKNPLDHLADSARFNRRIEDLASTIRHVAALRGPGAKVPGISFDEWNVWAKTTTPEDMNGRGKYAPKLIEEHYDLADAIVVAGFLNAIVRHADSIKIANIAQVVNVIAPIHTRGDDVLLHTIYWPFEMMTRRRDGVALQVAQEGSDFVSPNLGKAPVIDASFILGDGVLHAFVANRSLDAVHEVHIDLAGMKVGKVQSAEIVTGEKPESVNTFEKPDAVAKRAFNGASIDGGKVVLKMPALSFVAATIQVS